MKIKETRYVITHDSHSYYVRVYNPEKLVTKYVDFVMNGNPIDATLYTHKAEAKRVIEHMQGLGFLNNLYFIETITIEVTAHSICL